MEAGGPGAAAAQDFEEDDSELVYDDVGPEVGRSTTAAAGYAVMHCADVQTACSS